MEIKKIMRNFLIALTILIGINFNMISCNSLDDSILDENMSKKVMLSLKPTLEVNSTEVKTRAEENTVYAVLIQKINSNGEKVGYCYGLFDDLNKIFLLIDKGMYNIKVSSIEASQINITAFNYFKNYDEYTTYKDEVLDYVTSGTTFGNNYYGETGNITITKSSDINIKLKYMTFGIKLEGVNLLKTDILKLKFFNEDWSEIIVNYDNPISSIIKYKMPGYFYNYLNQDNGILSDHIYVYLNNIKLFENDLKIQVERKKITTIKIDCKRMGITKEDSILLNGNTIVY